MGREEESARYRKSAQLARDQLEWSRLLAAYPQEDPREATGQKPVRHRPEFGAPGWECNW